MLYLLYKIEISSNVLYLGSAGGIFLFLNRYRVQRDVGESWRFSSQRPSPTKSNPSTEASFQRPKIQYETSGDEEAFPPAYEEKKGSFPTHYWSSHEEAATEAYFFPTSLSKNQNKTEVNE